MELKTEDVADGSRRLPVKVLRLVAGKLGPGLGFGKLRGDGAVEVGVAGSDELQGRQDLAVEPPGVIGAAVLEAARENGLELGCPDLGGRVLDGESAKRVEVGPGV